MEKMTQLKRAFEQLDLKLEEVQYQQFLQYYDLLLEWNKVMNLTAITDFDEVIMKHFVDSLAIKNELDLTRSIRVLDLGTGAGFPGIPLKIAFPSLQIVLMDSLNKRIKFLSSVIDELKLKDIEAIHGRAKEYGRKEGYRESFDLCVSRAVANLATLSEYCIPFVKVGGYFIPYKSGKIEEELNHSKKAIEILGGKLNGVKTFSLPETDIERSFVFIKKQSETKKKYPRNAGKPSKEPL